MTTTNLWGDLSMLEIVRTPKSILEEQAEVLRRATQGRLTAEVVDAGDRFPNGDFVYDFELLVPALNYRYTLLTIKHGIDLYPAEITSHVHPGAEGRDWAVECANDDEFVRQIQAILSSEKPKRILSRLLSQT